MEDNIRFFGIGSLGWLIYENNVPTDKTCEFIMHPDNGSLLIYFFETLDPKELELLKPQYVRHPITRSTPNGYCPKRTAIRRTRAAAQQQRKQP
jgi:hypothetical protein